MEKEGFNPIKGEKVITTRRQLHVEYDLPLREDYGRFVEKVLTIA